MKKHFVKQINMFPTIKFTPHQTLGNLSTVGEGSLIPRKT